MKTIKYKQKGFTLIELMITITILIVVTVIGAPSITELIEKNKIKTAANSINSGIQVARSEAIKRNATVTFNLSNGQWNVLADNDIIALAQSEIAQTVIQDTIPSGTTTLTFNNLGMLEIGPDGLDNISRIVLTSQKTNYKLWVMLSNSGGSRVCNPDETTLSTSMIGCV